MIITTLNFAVHVLMSSFRVLAPVAQLLKYAIPIKNMATKAVKGKINFNTTHLKAGDPLPPYNGKLRIYNMRYCPYAQRTVLALLAKQIDFEVVNVNLVKKPEWLVTKSAFGKVPALEIAENVTIYESLVTVEYLDEVYPQRPLLPKDPLMKANDKIITEASSLIHGFFYRIMRNPDTVTDEHISSYHKGLTFIQDQLKKRGSKFLDGEQPGYADYMIWPWFERIVLLDVDERSKLDKAKYKPLLEYIDRMFQDPAVSEYLVPKDVMKKYIEPYRSGDLKNINYELMTQS